MPTVLDERSVKGAISKRVQKAKSNQPLHIPVTLEVFERGPGDRPKFKEAIDLDEVIVDPAGVLPRILRSDGRLDPDTFDALASRCRKRPIRLTCYPEQVGPLLSEKKITAILSGSRAGKTHLACAWLVIQWLKRGHQGADFGWLCPTRKHTRIPIKKLCEGRGAILPKELVVKFPKNELTTDQTIQLLDGSAIVLQHGNSDGDNLRGFKMEAYAIDEITGILHLENYRIAVNRTVDTAGPVFVASTPKQNHWAKVEIIDRAETEDGSSVIANFKLTCFDNPWIPQESIEEFIRTQGGREDPTVRREVFGEWVTDGLMAFPSWVPPRHLRDGPSSRVDEYGLKDLTWQACQGFWKHAQNWSYVGGQDFNVNPCSTVVCQVFGDPNDEATWGLFVLDEVLTKKTNTEGHAQHLADRYPNIPLSCDPTGAMKGAPAAQVGVARGSTTNTKIMIAYGFDAKACSYKSGKAATIRQVDSLALVNWLFKRDRLIVHKRCTELRRGLSELECTPDGRIAKTSGVYSITDQMSGPVDALRYLAWTLFHKQWLRDFKRPDAGKWPLAD